jgi:hypothetical protein
MSLRMVADTMATSPGVGHFLNNIGPILTFPGYPMPNDEVRHKALPEILITDRSQE